MYPYWPPYPYPAQTGQSLPTLEQLKEHRKMLDEFEKHVLDKDKEKKKKKPYDPSKTEAILFMWLMAPIITAGELLGAAAVWYLAIKPMLGF